MEVKGSPSFGWKFDIYFTPWIMASRIKGHKGNLLTRDTSAGVSLRIEGLQVETEGSYGLNYGQTIRKQ